MTSLLPEVFSQVEESLQFRVARQRVLASNLANVDTPGFRRAELHFDAALERAELQLSGTRPAHRTLRAGEPHWRVERQGPATGPDGNGVDFDQETLQMSRNAGAFNRNAEILSRLLSMTRVAITGE